MTSLGKNPIILNAALTAYYKLADKLTNYEKMKFNELDYTENIENQIKAVHLGSELNEK